MPVDHFGMLDRSPNRKAQAVEMRPHLGLEIPEQHGSAVLPSPKLLLDHIFSEYAADLRGEVSFSSNL